MWLFWTFKVVFQRVDITSFSFFYGIKQKKAAFFADANLKSTSL